MFLYIITMIEPTDKLPKDQQAGGSFMLAMGGLPGSDIADGPWSEEQREQVNRAVQEWYAEPPAELTKKHRSIRDSVRRQSQGDEYLFMVDFSHHDEGDPSVVMDDMNLLYEKLRQYCQCRNMTVTQYMSI